MRSFAVMTLKGGTGKTTTSVNVAHGLALSGRRVLLIDCDPQRNVAVTFGVQTDRGLAQLLLSGDVEISEVRENFFIIDSGGRRLFNVELLLSRREGREQRLRDALQYLKGCDYVICDCPPSMNLINMNVLAYSETVIVPVSMDHLSGVGAQQTTEIIEEMQRLTERDEIEYRILPTFYDARTKISAEILDQIRGRYGERVFETVIRVNTALREAPGRNMTIYEHAPLSRGAYDYYRLTEEIMESEESR
jgi:chromosome partitioning protein